MKDLAATKDTLDTFIISSSRKDAFIEDLIGMKNIRNSLTLNSFSKTYDQFTKKLVYAHDAVLKAMKILTDTEGVGDIHREFIEKSSSARDACEALLEILTKISELYAKMKTSTQKMSYVIEDVRTYYLTIIFGNVVAVVQAMMFFTYYAPTDGYITYYDIPKYSDGNRHIHVHWEDIPCHLNNGKKSFKIRILHSITPSSKTMKVPLILVFEDSEGRLIGIPMTLLSNERKANKRLEHLKLPHN